MNETPTDPAVSTRPRSNAGDFVGRVLFLLAGGLLLAAMVSCACNPVR
jgi:hypothetical protein